MANPSPQAPPLQDTAALLKVETAPIGPETCLEEVYHFFFKVDPQAPALPVVERGRPVGIISRSYIIEKFSRLYTRELHGRSPVRHFMNAAPLVVEQGAPLEELGQRISRESAESYQDGFILVENGLYAGMGTGQALLRELTERKEQHLASALERMRLSLQKAQDELMEKRLLQRELSIAHDIQKSLLPRQTPAVPGYSLAAFYQPAKEVGGDYYDFFTLPDGRLGLVVADVSGKGIPGSLGMTMARSVLRSQAFSNSWPAETLRKTNEVIQPDLPPGMFVTVFYAILDPAAHRVLCANSGHHPAILLRPSEGVYAVAPRGIALGVATPDEYHVSELAVDLAPGDLFLLYTDGVSEAMNAAREEYGEERLMDLLLRNSSREPAGMARALVEDLHAFTSGAPQNDDITLVFARRERG